MERRSERLKACTVPSLVHSFIHGVLSRESGLCYLFPVPVSYILQGSD